MELYFGHMFMFENFGIQKHYRTFCSNQFYHIWFNFVKIITSVLCLDKFWKIHRTFISLWSLFCEILSFISVVVCSMEIHLRLNIICIEYFSCIHALLLLAKLFITSFWLDVIPCINFVAAESVLNLWSKIVKLLHAF